MVDHQRSGNASASASENPFSQQGIEGLSYRFPDGSGWASNVDRLRQSQFRGLIVGRCGTGKSTLIRELQTRVSGAASVATRPITEPLQMTTIANRSIAESIHSTMLLDIPRIDDDPDSLSRYRVASRRQQRSVMANQLQDLDPGTLLLVDGVERLAWLDRQRLVHRTAAASRVAGLIVIVHHHLNWLRLPVWIETRPSGDLLIELIDDLLAGHPESIRSRIHHRARILFQQHCHNIRATLRQLFDEWSSLSQEERKK